MKIRIITLVIILFASLSLFSQVSLNSGFEVDYTSPKEYKIGGITISGVKFLDENVLIQLSGLQVGDVINVPGDKISGAIKKLWKQNLFSDVKITIVKNIKDQIFLDIYLQERPRLSKFSFHGIKKSEADDLRETINLVKGNQITDNIVSNTTNIIKNYFIDKGFYKTTVEITQENDSLLANSIIININVDKKEKVKINAIIFDGNKALPENKLLKAMKETKKKRWYGIFKASKFIDSNFKTDKRGIIAKYNELGYRDAQIISDTIYNFSEDLLNIDIKIKEGNKYYFRNITWVGNTKYSSKLLSEILGIHKGDIFNQTVLDDKLSISPVGVSSLYLDNGYLFFSAIPVEVNVENDSIDLEIRIYEGKQATIKNVTIVGNTKTNEHVIRREITTKPGELFSRADIIRTQRELSQLGYFNAEKLNVNPVPNPVDGTVDLEYIVEEQPSDQIELSGGWGAQMIVGTLGISFNNFSTKNMFKKEAWRPLPAGDGQRLSIRAQSNGLYYQAYNMSFVEPWLGGKKPNSLSVSAYHTILSNGIRTGEEGRQSMKITGLSLGLGRRLKWPDDYFQLYNSLSYSLYDLNNYEYYSLFTFNDGIANDVSFLTSVSRSSVDKPIYPRKGSLFSVSLQITPPYSAFEDKDYSTMSDQDKYKFIEYHKWKFSGSVFTKIIGDLVLNTKAEFGILGLFNKDLGPSPFGGFNVGGDGLMSYNIGGTETIALRGYENSSLTPSNGGNIYNKFTMELRYLISPNPSATLYGLAFVEGGNAWYKKEDFNPFSIHRSAGVGVRIFLPMFGKLGVDWGYGFDDIPGKPGSNKGQFHFIIGQNF